MFGRSASLRQSHARFAAALAAVALLVIACGQPAQSQDPVVVQDFSQLTPLPYVPVTPTVPDYDPPGCVYPEAEATPGLPPLSCRNQQAEPHEGSVPTARPDERPTGGGAAQDGWLVLDNKLFRYTVAMPPDYHSNMRSEGGEFILRDPASVAEEVNGAKGLGGVVVIFTARASVPDNGSAFVPAAEQHLRSPNLTLGGYPAATWEDDPVAGLAKVIMAAFLRDGIVFEVRIHIDGDDRDESDVANDASIAMQIVRSLAPY